jgi:hypothetical protein
LLSNEICVKTYTLKITLVEVGICRLELRIFPHFNPLIYLPGISRAFALYGINRRNKMINLKNEGQEGKTNPVPGLEPVGGHKEGVNEGEYIKVLCIHVRKWSSDTC